LGKYCTPNSKCRTLSMSKSLMQYAQNWTLCWNSRIVCWFKISSHTLNEVPHHIKHLNGSKRVEIVTATRECGCGHLVNERKVIWLQFLHIRTHLALAV
jgi:hypothetical protein